MCIQIHQTSGYHTVSIGAFRTSDGLGIYDTCLLAGWSSYAPQMIQVSCAGIFLPPKENQVADSSTFCLTSGGRRLFCTESGGEQYIFPQTGGGVSLPIRLYRVRQLQMLSTSTRLRQLGHRLTLVLSRSTILLWSWSLNLKLANRIPESLIDSWSSYRCLKLDQNQSNKFSIGTYPQHKDQPTTTQLHIFIGFCFLYLGHLRSSIQSEGHKIAGTFPD